MVRDNSKSSHLLDSSMPIHFDPINKSIRFSNYSEIVEADFLGLNKAGEAKIKLNQEEKIIQSGIINYWSLLFALI